jgi:hypothetical protein
MPMADFRERLLSCARGGDIIVPIDQLFLGLDWGSVSDQTIATVGNDQNDGLVWFAYSVCQSSV